MALGLTKSEIADEFYDKDTYSFDSMTGKWKTRFNPENYKAKNFSEEVSEAAKITPIWCQVFGTAWQKLWTALAGSG